LAVRAGQRWRRSLQARVVVTTLVASGVVVALLASLLLDQVGRGLVATKTRSALSEAQSGLLQAQAQVGGGETRTSVVESRLQGVAQVLSERGAAGGQYTIVLSSAGGQGKAFASPGTRPADVPPELTARLDAGEQVAYVFAVVPTVDGRRRAMVVGAELTTPVGPYRMFHLFPLTAEQDTLALVRRTAAAAGVLLVLLLVLIAGLVTRQVVHPVQLAARTAERLADGQLEERMRVRGEDEIARLAMSFNSMAGALQRQIRQLEDLSRLQQRFVSDVSHELRTPLTTVRMAADVLHEARQDFPPAAARSAELLQAQLGRFEELLAELLEISRYDAGAASLDAEPLDLLVLVDRVAQAFGALADRRGSALLVHAAGPVVAEIDHVRVERILRNLVVNAIEHGEGQPVEVTVTGGRSCVAVLVRDHGVGLRPGETALVFTRFWRGDPSRARTTGGTGLGLAIAFEDARLHGGRLQAWGAPGQGAAFLLTLPLRVGGALGESPLPLVPSHVTPVLS
jgi:two-component system sensor histidine kinase MtrB